MYQLVSFSNYQTIKPTLVKGERGDTGGGSDSAGVAGGSAGRLGGERTDWC